MNRKFLPILFALTGSLDAQTWRVELDLDLAEAGSAINAAGEILIVGSPARDAHAVRLDADGQVVGSWTLEAPGSGDVRLRAAAFDAQDRNVVVGSYQFPDAFRSFVAVLDHEGSVVWRRAPVGVDSGFEGVEALRGGDLLCYGTYREDGGPREALLVRLSSAGAVKWRRGISVSTADEWIADAVETEDAGLLLLSVVTGLSASVDWVVTRLDALGNRRWQAHYSMPTQVHDGRICLARDGGFYVSGSHGNRSNRANDQVALLRCDASGDLEWSRAFLSYPADHNQRVTYLGVAGIVPRPEGGVAVLTNQPTSRSRSIENDLALLLVDALGNRLAYRTYGEVERFEGAIGLHRLPGSGYALVGDLKGDGRDPITQALCVDTHGNTACPPQPDIYTGGYDLGVARATVFHQELPVGPYYVAPGFTVQSTPLAAPRSCAQVGVVAAFNYGQGTPGTGGITPRLRATPGFTVNNTPVITLDQAVAASPGLLVLGTGRRAIPMFGGSLLVDPSSWLVTLPFSTSGSPGAGSGEFCLRLPTLAGASGLSLYWQGAVLDSQASFGLAFTDGLQIAIF